MAINARGRFGHSDTCWQVWSLGRKGGTAAVGVVRRGHGQTAGILQSGPRDFFHDRVEGTAARLR